jgi:hypothetical protein
VSVITGRCILFQLTIVTSSIFEILRTNMLTRTTAGPSNMANRTNKINQSLSSSQIHREVEMCACVWYDEIHRSPSEPPAIDDEL